jgi:hypothetical protein
MPTTGSMRLRRPMRIIGIPAFDQTDDGALGGIDARAELFIIIQLALGQCRGG